MRICLLGVFVAVVTAAVNKTCEGTKSEKDDMEKVSFVGSIVSMCFSSFVVVSFLKFKELRVYPSSLVALQSVCDYFVSLILVISYAYDDVMCHCTAFASLLQFALFASMTWFLVMAYDLVRTLRNPFGSLAGNMPVYHAIVWSLSALTSIILALAFKSEFREDMGVCYLARTEYAEQINFGNWLLFFGPLGGYTLCGLGALIYACKRLSKGLESTFDVRTKVLRAVFGYVMAFTLYWVVAGSVYFATYSHAAKQPAENPIDTTSRIYVLQAVTVAMRGAVLAIAWVINQSAIQVWVSWCKKEKRPDIVQSPVNVALRGEVLAYTTQGICQSLGAVDDLSSRGKSESKGKVEEVGKVVCLIQLSPDDINKVPFTDYAPLKFRAIREACGVSDEEYRSSFGGDQNKMKEKYTEGRSGSFFYFTADFKFIVKTVSRGEKEFLLRILPAYMSHVLNHPETLINKLVGFHSVILFHTTITFIVMLNVFTTTRELHNTYDLKGSTVDRNRKPGVKGVFKDNDLKFKVHLQDGVRKQFLDQVEIDTKFMESQNIMDYSLLLGIHNTRHIIMGPGTSEELKLRKGAPFFAAKDGGMEAKIIEGPGLFFMGIIDILQEYNTQKKVERFLKTKFLFKDSNGLSAMAPMPYRQRFCAFMKEITEDDYATAPIKRMTVSTQKSNVDRPDHPVEEVEDHGSFKFFDSGKIVYSREPGNADATERGILTFEDHQNPVQSASGATSPKKNHVVEIQVSEMPEESKTPEDKGEP